MKYLTAAILGTMAAAAIHCSDGGSGIVKSSTPATGDGNNDTGGGGSQGNDQQNNGTGGSNKPGTGGNTSGTAGSESTGTAGSMTGMGGMAGTMTMGGTGGAAGAGGAGGSMMPGGGLRTGPFKMLVLTTTLEFHHDSIPTCLTLLQDLGKGTAPERAKITGLASDATWTVDEMGSQPSAANYFSEITAENLAKYEMLYSDNPTGPVFTNAPNGAQKKTIFQDWFTKGGAWAGQHSATDFENNSRWTWFNDHVNGGWFTDHDNDNTPGTVNWQADYADHPILKGLASPWNTSDEWYIMNRNIEAVPGFKILAKVTVTNSSKPNGAQPRPAIWITETDMGGRAFYTIRGHNQKVYAEPEFRDLMLRGILWAVHRLPGGN